MKSKYLFFVLIILLVTGSAMALPLVIGDFGRKIITGDGIPNSGEKDFSASGDARKYDGLNYQSITQEPWELDVIHWNSPILSIVGNMDYVNNGDNSGTSYTMGDSIIGDYAVGLAQNDDDNLDGSTYALKCNNDTIHGSLSEPASIILIGTGLVGISGFGRKKLVR